MEISHESKCSADISDKYYLIQILFYFSGVFSVIAKDFFITANDYWMYKFRDPSLNYDDGSDDENRTDLQAQFTSTFSIVHVVFAITAALISVVSLLKFSIIKRLYISMIVTLIIMIVTVVLAFMETDNWQDIFFGITMVTGAVLSASCAVFAVSVFQFVPKFPPQYLTFAITGLAIAGLFSAFTQILTLSFETNSKTSGILYFIIGTIFVLCTLIAYYFALKKSKFFQFYFYNEVSATEKLEPNMKRALLIRVLNKTKYYIFGLVLIVGTSSLIHPAITSLAISENKGNGNKWSDQFFVPVISFFTYNVFDLLSREVARVIQKPRGSLVIIIGGLVRLGTVPLFMFCNLQPRHHLKVLFGDEIYIILIIIFGITNGYLVNLVVIQIPQVTTYEENQLASIVIMVVMMLCVVPFSFLSPVIIKLL